MAGKANFKLWSKGTTKIRVNLYGKDEKNTNHKTVVSPAFPRRPS